MEEVLSLLTEIREGKKLVLEFRVNRGRLSTHAIEAFEIEIEELLL
jgi:hypothetical protein